MRDAFCSSGLLIDRASIMGVMPSVQVTPARWNAGIMLMSMKSTPSGLSSTPASSRSATSAVVNLATWLWAAGPAAPLIHV